MKKMFSIALASCLLLTGCASAAAAGQKTSEIEISAIGNDYTVTPTVIFEKPDSAVQVGHGIMDYLYATTPDSVVEKSTLIVTGNIEEMYYTAIGDTAWLQMDVRIAECKYGDFQAGDIISIYTQGGYIPMTQYWADSGMLDENQSFSDSEMYLDMPEGIDLPEKGDSCLFFADPADERFPEGAYENSFGYPHGIYTEKDGVYTNKIGEDTISAEDMDALIAEK